MKTQASKNREYIKKHVDKTLRGLLSKEDITKKCCVLYNDRIVGINYPNELICNSSNAFQTLLNKDVKDVIRGVTIYVIL